MAQGTTHPEDPFNEAVATTGLFLTMTAIIALAVALASWGMNEMMFAVLAGAVALTSFTASIFCFKAQATEQVAATAEVPA